MHNYISFTFIVPLILQDPTIRPLVEQDAATLQRMFPEIPLWVKNPDFDRVWFLLTHVCFIMECKSFFPDMKAVLYVFKG